MWHLLTALQNKAVPVNNSLHNFKIAMRCGLISED
jgi:hypothetical protein